MSVRFLFFFVILFIFSLNIFGQKAEAPKTPNEILQAQIALANRGFSAGAIDGQAGFQFRDALKGFQLSKKLTETGKLNAKTKSLLTTKDIFTTYTITRKDIDSLTKNPNTWLEKSKAQALGYETVLELIGEKFHTHVNLIKRLNPKVEWTKPKVGTEVKVPNVTGFKTKEIAERIEVLVSSKIVRVFNQKGELIAQFPCSIGKDKENIPTGDLKVANFAENPEYYFSPLLFVEAAAEEKIEKNLVIPPGANNPVGLVWIGLNKPGYGIHGTPVPESIGRTESHGCFRLANWDAKTLLKMVKVGMSVKVVI